MTQTIISFQNVSKRYGNTLALDNLSFEIEKGQVFGLIGPNGSGKTTTIRIILDLIRKYEGKVSLFENKYSIPNKKIGVVLENQCLDEGLKAQTNVRLSILRKGGTDITSSESKYFGDNSFYESFKKKKIKKLSLGMKQRTTLLSATVGNPDLLILDEPTNGLDHKGVLDLRSFITAFAKDGKTILITSHNLVEMEKICTHICLIKEGKNLFAGSIASVLEQYKTLENLYQKILL